MLCTTGYFAVLILLAVVVIDASLLQSERVGNVHQQPASVRYTDDYGLHPTHYVALTHDRSRIFGRHQGYELYAGVSKDLFYGHFVHLDFVGAVAIKFVSWTKEGVRVRFTSGHEVFVPARYFVGGR
ncbi:hypothetical protein E1281_04305 [Actinomadura sp. KC345]|uniref:hypothetical protein n=1 Tax=Actinomadura sp. KC345 TaxID=2530371 RepID=UPI0010446A59|nr:hypothetical protein [Actinomadura sp. KC345]TDC57643.1 hypothetical protein E1281_04305 [Actinomadura sp. KC345]